MAKYRAVFFDADDTLFDYPKAEREALFSCLNQFKIPGGEPGDILERYRRHNLELWKAFEKGEVTQDFLKKERFKRLFSELGINDISLAEVSAFYLKNLALQSHLLAGALELIRVLVTDYALALITNGIAAVQRPRFAASAIIPYFRAVIISEEVGYTKPDPRIFEPALKMIRVSPAEVLYVGDSISSDMAAAHNAGIDFCWFNPAKAPIPVGYNPRFIVPDLASLRLILKKKGNER